MTLSALAAVPTVPGKVSKTARAAQNMQLPLVFEANHGQTSAQALYLARSQGSVVFLTAQGAVVKNDQAAVGMRFVGSSASATTRGSQASATRVNYLVGRDHSQWQSVTAFGRVDYSQIYPGVDASFYGHAGQLEYDLLVAPGANAAQIGMSFKGAAAVLEGNGDLKVGPMTLRLPIAYQTIAGHRSAVSVAYARRANGQFGFAVGNYDHSQPLVIDPVLAFSTFLGGTGFNQASAVAVDSKGSAYVAGFTQSTDFPVIAGSLQTALKGAASFDAFVAKFSADGTKLVYSTFLGGSGDDEATGIAVDSAGDAYVTGSTSSTDFPVTAGAVQAANAGGLDAFVAKLNPAGTALIYATYVGGAQDDRAAGIAIDGSGDAFIAGVTASANFPVSAGAPQTAFGGGQDAFVTAINAAGSGLLYSTYLGGSGVDKATGIAVDLTGNAYVSGTTASSNFPITAGALQTTIGGGFDAFVTRVNRSGHSLDYSTYLGGSKLDEANAIAVDSAGDAFVTGDTSSINLFTNASSAFQPSFAGGNSDAFVAELNPTGSALQYGSYLGGTATDVGTAIVLSGQSAFIAGSTSSVDFPVVSAAQTATGGVLDAFVAEFDSVGQKLLYSTYMGGVNNDSAQGLGIDAAGELYVVGVTSSSNFPTTAGSFQVSASGAANAFSDGFVAKFVNAPQGVFSNAIGFVAQAVGVAATAQSVTFTNNGEKPLTITGIAVTGPYKETDNCNANSSTLAPLGGKCTFNIVFTPTAVGAQNGTLVVSDNAPGGSQTLNITGSGGDFSVTASPTSETISAGASASFSFNVTPANGYTQVVALTCTGNPMPGATTCVPSPTSLTMNGTTASTATFTITTTVRPALIPPVPSLPAGPWTWMALFALALAGAGALYSLLGRRSSRLTWASTALLLGWALAASACGGTTQSAGTPAGNYTLTLTGTATGTGGAAHSVPVTLTVD
jgi:hypothetical protein